MKNKLFVTVFVFVSLSLAVSAEIGIFDNTNYHLKNITNITKISSLSLNGVLSWTYLYGFPAACPAGQAITAINDTITCSIFITDTQLQVINTTKSGTGNCAGSSVIQNFTSTGVQCVNISSSPSSGVSRSTMDQTYTISGINAIRMLWNTTYRISKNTNNWGEAYISSAGIGNSVGGTTNATFNATGFSYYANGTRIIEHAIPSGVLPSNISSAIGVAFINSWEVGGDIQYKLNNSASDTGWLNSGKSPIMTSFTAFSSEPTKLYVKLIPNTTIGKPAIKGFWVFVK